MTQSAETKPIPTLEAWLVLPMDEVAGWVSPGNLAIKLNMDGTTRNYLLSHPTASGRVEDYADYTHFCMVKTARIFDMLYGCGLQTVLAVNAWPPNMDRHPNYLQNILGASQKFLLAETFRALYQRWNLKVRLYGDYDVQPNMAQIREGLNALDAQLAEVTPSGDRLLLWGYHGETFMSEAILRTLALAQDLGRAPTHEELRQACFPHGPQEINIYLGSGWLRFGNTDLPPVLNNASANIYSLSTLMYDVSEHSIRRILYDCVFRRHVTTAKSDLAYTPDVLETLREFYEVHEDDVLGLGQLVGPGFWYPE